MDTDELIAALAADDIPASRPRLLLRVGLGLIVSLLLMLIFWGLRPGWPEILFTTPSPVKLALPLLVALIAALWLRRAAPEPVFPLRPLWLLALACLAAWGWAALTGGDVQGRSLWQCLLSIPALSAPIGIALFLGLRHRVEPAPTRSGLVAGLFAGGAGAAIYALHCDEDSAAFFLIWYGVAILICGAAGRLAGRRWLGV